MKYGAIFFKDPACLVPSEQADFDILSNEDKLRAEIFKEIAFVDKWIDQWNDKILVLAQKSFVKALNKHGMPEITGFTAEEIADAAFAAYAFGGKNPVWDAYSKATRDRKDSATNYIETARLSLINATDLHRQGISFRQRHLLSNGKAPSHPNWAQWDDASKAAYIFEENFFSQYHFLSGAFIRDPQILSYLVRDAGFDPEGFYIQNCASEIEMPTSHLWKLWADRYTLSNATSAVPEILPHTWRKTVDLHVGVANELREQIVAEKVAKSAQELMQYLRQLDIWQKTESAFSLLLPRDSATREAVSQNITDAFASWRTQA